MNNAKVITLNLKDFRNAVSDIARPNRFEVKINSPEIFDTKNDNQVKVLSWLAETAQIPSRTQGEIKIKFHGMELKLPGDYERENLTIGFLNSYDWECRNFFELWMETIQGIATTNQRSTAFDMICGSTIIVNQLGRTEKDILASYEFYNAFPTNISAIDLNMTEYDSLEKFTVSFAYSHFISLATEASNG